MPYLLNVLRSLQHDERGAAYSLSVVITIPLYAATMAFVLEFSMLLLSGFALQAGMIDATHTLAAYREMHLEGDRSTEDLEQLEILVKHQMVRKMLSFATTTTVDTQRADEFTTSDNQALMSFVEASGIEEEQLPRFEQKIRFLQSAIHVEIEQESANSYQIRIAYDVPLRIPMFNRLLESHRHTGLSLKRISTECLIEFANAGTLNLPYSPGLVKSWKRHDEP